MTKAVANYASDVRKKKFPLKKHSYWLKVFNKFFIYFKYF
jgi:ketopantoate hydroxymethyltransferase